MYIAALSQESLTASCGTVAGSPWDQLIEEDNEGSCNMFFPLFCAKRSLPALHHSTRESEHRAEIFIKAASLTLDYLSN